MPYPRSRHPSLSRGDRMRMGDDGQSMDAPYSQSPRTRVPRSRPPRYDRNERSERTDRYSRDRMERPMRERPPRPRYSSYDDRAYSPNNYQSSDSNYNYEAPNLDADASTNISTDEGANSYPPRSSARHRAFETIPALRRRTTVSSEQYPQEESQLNSSQENNEDVASSESTDNLNTSYSRSPYNSGYSRGPREYGSAPQRSSDGSSSIYGYSNSRPSRYSRDSYPPRRRPPLGSKYSSRPPRKDMGGPILKGKGGPTRAMQAQTSAMIAGIHSNDTLTSHALNQMNNYGGYDSRYRSDRNSRYNRNSNISTNTVEEDAVILRRFKALMDFGSIPEDQNDLPLLSSDLNPPEDSYNQDDSYDNRYSDRRSSYNASTEDVESKDEDAQDNLLATNAKPYINSYIQKSEEDNESSEQKIEHIPLNTSDDGQNNPAVVVRRSRSRIITSSSDSSTASSANTEENKASQENANEGKHTIYRQNSYATNNAYDDDDGDDDDSTFNSIEVDPSAHSAQSVYSHINDGYADYTGQAHYKVADEEYDDEYQESEYEYNHAAYASDEEDDDDDIHANSINYSTDEQIYPSQYATDYTGYNNQSNLNDNRVYNKKSGMIDNDDEYADSDDEYDSYYDDEYDYDDENVPYSDLDVNESLMEDDYDYVDEEEDFSQASDDELEEDEDYPYYNSYANEEADSSEETSVEQAPVATTSVDNTALVESTAPAKRTRKSSKSEEESTNTDEPVVKVKRTRRKATTQESEEPVKAKRSRKSSVAESENVKDEAEEKPKVKRTRKKKDAEISE